jgi:hypothetical protein
VAVELLFGDLLMSGEIDDVAKEFVYLFTAVLENGWQRLLIRRRLNCL